MIVDLGAYIVLTDDSPGLWHIPVPATAEATYLAPALCGLIGATLVYRGATRTLRACPVCLKRAPAHLEAHPDEAEDDGQPAPRRGKPKGKYRLISDVQLRALHRAYTEQGLSCRQLGERVYQKLGYKSGRSCAEAIYIYFREAGLPVRTREQAITQRNWRHGRATRQGRDAGGDYGPDGYRAWHRQQTGRARPPCAGHRQNYPRRGQPCQHPAMTGSDYCAAHDPARRDHWRAHLTKARALRDAA